MGSCDGFGRRWRHNLPMRIHSLNLGPVGPEGAGSSGATLPVSHRVTVEPLGLEGGPRADPSRRNARAHAICAYPLEHYAFWRTVRAQARVAAWDAPLPAGSLGEQLTLSGLLEPQAWVGDRLRFARCTLAVSHPRWPGATINRALGFAQAARLMTQSGFCGFWLAVLEPGSLAAGDRFELVPGPREVSIADLFRAGAPPD
jgi:MOSC domain-containing protein YiiM